MRKIDLTCVLFAAGMACGCGAASVPGTSNEDQALNADIAGARAEITQNAIPLLTASWGYGLDLGDNLKRMAIVRAALDRSLALLALPDAARAARVLRTPAIFVLEASPGWSATAEKNGGAFPNTKIYLADAAMRRAYQKLLGYAPQPPKPNPESQDAAGARVELTSVVLPNLTSSWGYTLDSGDNLARMAIVKGAIDAAVALIDIGETGRAAESLKNPAIPILESSLGWTATQAKNGSNFPSTKIAIARAGIDTALAKLAALTLPNRPYIIEFGWDTPQTAADVAKLDLANAPFDGAVLDPKLLFADGSEGHFANMVFQNAPLADSDLERDSRVSGLLTPFGRFATNLLRVNGAPLSIGFGQDFSTVAANMKRSGQLVAQYHLLGLMLDVEMYGNSQAWDPSRGTPDQARSAGRTLGAAYAAAAPGTAIVLTFAHSYVLGQQAVGSHAYDLLPPFIDGLMEGTPSTIQIVDGYEISYGFRFRGGSWFPDDFNDARSNIRSARSASLVPALYDQRMKAGFGIWADNKHVWDSANFANNYFTPDELQTSIAAAAAASDGWVWIYSELPSWYDPARPMPAPYVAAVDHSRP